MFFNFRDQKIRKRNLFDFDMEINQEFFQQKIFILQFINQIFLNFFLLNVKNSSKKFGIVNHVFYTLIWCVCNDNEKKNKREKPTKTKKMMNVFLGIFQRENA